MDNKHPAKPNSLPDLLQNKFADPYFLISGVKGGLIPVDQDPTTVPSGTKVGKQVIHLLPGLNLGGRPVLCDDRQWGFSKNVLEGNLITQLPLHSLNTKSFPLNIS